jgi:hypothetical protein
MESLFAALKTEHVHQAQFHTRAEARAAVFEYIEAFYNTAAPALGFRLSHPGRGTGQYGRAHYARRSVIF